MSADDINLADVGEAAIHAMAHAKLSRSELGTGLKRAARDEGIRDTVMSVAELCINANDATRRVCRDALNVISPTMWGAVAFEVRRMGHEVQP